MKSYFPSLLIFCATAICLAATNSSAAETNPRVVRVSGHGEVRVVPDEVLLTIAIKTHTYDLLEAVAENETESQGLLTLAERHKVKPGEFQVTRSDISYAFDNERSRLRYTVEREAEITFRGLENLNALLADALKQGGFQIKGMQFRATKASEKEGEARRLAVLDARSKATQLAELNGLKLGKALEIEINEFDYQPFVTSVMPAVAGIEPPRRLTDDPLQALPINAPARDIQDATFDREGQTQFVSFQEKKPGQEKAAAQPAAAGKASLGVISFSIRISINFELVE